MYAVLFGAVHRLKEMCTTEAKSANTFSYRCILRRLYSSSIQLQMVLPERNNNASALTAPKIVIKKLSKVLIFNLTIGDMPFYHPSDPVFSALEPTRVKSPVFDLHLLIVECFPYPHRRRCRKEILITSTA